MNRETKFFWAMTACAVGATILGTVKAENQMLKNTLEDFGAKIDEMSNAIERLMRDLDRNTDWNKETDGF